MRSSGNVSLDHLETVPDAVLLREVHAPVAIPTTAGATRPVDLAIVGEYHGTRLPGADRREVVDTEMRGQLRPGAYCIRQRHYQADSFRLLRIANRDNGWDLASVLYAAKLVPHWLMFAFRRAFTWRRRLDLTTPCVAPISNYQRR
jgi:hypothetical protein